jgi:hypothetical protein
MTDFTNPGFKHDEFTKKMQCILKELLALDIVADGKTLEPIHAFQQYYSQCAMELMNLKIPLEVLVGDEFITQRRYSFCCDKISEIIERLKHNPYKDPDESRKFVEIVYTQYNEYCAERDKYSFELDKLQKQIFNLNLDLKRRTVGQIANVQKHIDEFVQAARKDLDLPAITVDENSTQKYYKSIHESLELIWKNAKKLVEEDEFKIEALPETDV